MSGSENENEKILIVNKRFRSFYTGFGTFGKTSKNEEVDDIETQHVKNIMGISAFGRKAKNFDITVSEILNR